jgi:hypothetical protein
VPHISAPLFLYGFIGLIFGLPFVYFAWRTGQRWRAGENLLTGRLYATCLAYSVLSLFHGLSAGRWPLAAFGLFLLVGSSWMRLVERNDSRA